MPKFNRASEEHEYLMENHNRTDKILDIDLEYPRNDNAPIDTIDINLVDVRANDGIRIKYDFDRDGFVIYQPKRTLVHVEGNSWEEQEEWIESAFLEAWKYAEDRD